jgi:PqqD family protein of HPr-rel-A system
MTGPRFIADPPDATRRVELDGLTALYHRPSGLTHILAAPAPQILDALAGKAGDAGEIAARIAADFEIESDDAEGAIAARLAELEAAGLVRRA